MTGPSARWSYAMAFHEPKDEFVLFGGFITPNFLPGDPRLHSGETWSYGQPAITLTLDILPSDDPNLFVSNKTSKGQIPMAIFATEEVAAADIKPESIKIAGVLGPVKISTDKDEDGDDLVDLVMHFSRRGLIDALSLNAYDVGDVVEVTVTAVRVGDDRPIEATDSIVIVGSED